tara:strand:- start:638 stop:1066 length:429 start_codon:yes stop_codon:yes gene_type:complete
MRVFFWLSFVLGGLVLVFGAASLRWGSASFGFGLWVASSWMMLSRSQAWIAGRPAPWSRNLAVELQTVMDRARVERCCSTPTPHWEVQCIACSTCGAVLSRTARPDLGRPRSDGRIAGMLRLLITDGHPIASPLPEVKLEEE